ncbi:MAG: 50S ribosomal protein L24 [Gammaproteobacteria bacterium]|nr:50S ribosomal protein L24 [Gammaproteobacteria bacterium]MXW07254.1 50S ribosomal protein L24 [Gammaproteobacteria bacterium]MYC25480.1 50S ribosomal protein L24 [Gammaproteobacteria bacterium]
MRRIQVDDEVIILTGKDKGRTGDVVEFRGEDRVIVSGINEITRHTRALKPGDRHGRLQKEAPLHISNVAILNPETEKADKVGIRIEDGKKVRYFKSNGALIED